MKLKMKYMKLKNEKRKLNEKIKQKITHTIFSNMKR